MKADRITARQVADMSGPEFDRLMALIEGPRGSTLPMSKILEIARKTMSPPRRPRGEKPATTIRILRRQLATAQQTIAALQLDRSDKEKVIAGYDVQLSEAQDTAHRIARSAMERRERHAAELAAARADSARLAFLEGYYAKSQEALSTTRAPFAGDQSEAHPRERPRNQEGLSPQRQDPEGARGAHGPAGIGSGTGDQVRSVEGGDFGYPQRPSVEHVTIRHWRDAADDWMAS